MLISNARTLIPNELGAVFELGVQRLESLEQLKVQYSQALAKPEREKNFAQQVIRSTYVQSDSHRNLSSPVSLSLQSAI